MKDKSIQNDGYLVSTSALKSGSKIFVCGYAEGEKKAFMNWVSDSLDELVIESLPFYAIPMKRYLYPVGTPESGDSGGGVFVREPDNTLRLTGIVSTGSAFIQHFSFYKISQYFLEALSEVLKDHSGPKQKLLDQKTEKLSRFENTPEANKWFRHADFMLTNHQPDLAKKFYKKAAELGHVKAQHCLAWILESAEPILARKWYEKASKQGFAPSQLNLGNIFMKDDVQKAFYWFQKAAEQGLPGAQYSVGMMLLNGYGTIQNLEAARMWLEKADKRGYLKANGLSLDIIHNEF